MSEQQPVSSTICVTGGSGFLGSWCVSVLLERGHTVRTTVRTLEKAVFLQKLKGAERLTIYPNCDLLNADSFNEAIEGCDYVLHTASPFYFPSGDDAEDVLVTPALQGTENVLNVCKKYGVKRVALTSSTAAVYANYGTKDKDYVWTSQDWSDAEMLRKVKNFYCLSKTLAERRAWEMSKEEGCPYTLTVLNPTLIWGPMLPGQTHLNTSCQSLLGFIDGTKKKIDNACKSVVDVRDVALAHVLAVESDAGAGSRFLLIAGSPHFSEFVEYIKEVTPDDMIANVPTELSEEIGTCTIGSPPPHPVLYDASPSEKTLGLKYISVKDMTASTIMTMLANGFKSCGQYALA